jgi:glutathionylspermidine synthase
MSIELDPRQWAMKVLDDLVPRMDVYAHEVPDERFDNAFDRIYDKDQGFGRISDGMGKVLVDLPEDNPYDREHTSGYLADAIKKAGFDAKTQAVMMTYFYRHGSFRDDATRNLREVP